MFGISDPEMLFRQRVQPQAPSAMPMPIGPAVGVGDPTALQPQASNTAPPPVVGMPMPAPVKKQGPQSPGGGQGMPFGQL